MLGGAPGELGLRFGGGLMGQGMEMLQLFGEDFARGGAHAVQIGVPELEPRLLLEPAFADEEAVDDAGVVVLPARLAGRRHHFARDDRAVGAGDFRLFQLAWYDLLDLVFEPESYFGDFGGRDGGGDAVAAGDGEDCGVCQWGGRR